MVKKGIRTLLKAVSESYPWLEEPRTAVLNGQIIVDGRVVKNPQSMIGPGSMVTLAQQPALRGEAKLRAALNAFSVSVMNRVALDVGAAAGGFTKVLLESGARRVYAVDVGHGQLIGSLRQDGRVINLESTNVGELNPGLVSDVIDVITLDLSYLALADAVQQLEQVQIAPNGDLVALVKPMFELHWPYPPEPDNRCALDRAVALAVTGISACAWRVINSIESPVRGSRGTVEFLVHAKRL